MYSKFHRLPRAWLETFGDRAPLKRNSIFELAWIGEGITSAARETRLKEEEEGNSRWRGIERRKGYFFLLNFTKGAPMTLTIAIPVCVSCEMGNERQTSTMSFHYFSSSSSFSLLSNFITRFSHRREMHPEFRSSRFIFSQRIERIVLYIPPKEKILQERSRYPAFANTIDSGGGRWRGVMWMHELPTVSFQQWGRHEFWVVSLSDRLASSYRQEFIGLVIALANKRGDRGAREGWKAMARCNWYRW